jgi:RNA polymerase sigma-70 factor (ECF subfamily)
MAEQSEQTIARGLREGKPDAWQSLYDAYAERVWRSVACQMGTRAADVADVVQETFLAAARSAASYDTARGSLWVWLSGIARNQVALCYRKQARHNRVKEAEDWLATGNGHLLRWLDGRDESPNGLLASAELATLVRATLAGLPEDYGALLAARYLDDIPVEQLAQGEQSTAVAVRSKLARARRAFREAFQRAAQIESREPLG